MTRPIRILSVFQEIGWGGDESRLLAMAIRIDRTRFEHSVLSLLENTSDREHAGFSERVRQYEDMGVVVRSLSQEKPAAERSPNSGPLQRKVAILHQAMRLARLVKRWKIDVLDVRTAAYFVGALAGRLSSTPTVVTLYHGIRDGDRVTWPWPLRTALMLTDCVLTDSEVRAAEFRSHVGRRKDKVVVIPNGIPQPHSELGICQARELFGLPCEESSPVIGQVGRLIEFKGQTILLRAAPSILARYPKARFLIVGFTEDAAYRERLQQLADELGIADHVRIISYPGPIGDVWRAIDIHVHPSIFDSLPVSIAEGMSWSKPAVVTSAGGIPELVEHGKTGLVVPPGDPTALASAILRLLDDPALARQLGQAARRRYEQRYRPEIMTQALEELFLQMAN